MNTAWTLRMVLTWLRLCGHTRAPPPFTPVTGAKATLSLQQGTLYLGGLREPAPRPLHVGLGSEQAPGGLHFQLWVALRTGHRWVGAANTGQRNVMMLKLGISVLLSWTEEKKYRETEVWPRQFHLQIQNSYFFHLSSLIIIKTTPTSIYCGLAGSSII